MPTYTTNPRPNHIGDGDPPINERTEAGAVAEVVRRFVNPHLIEVAKADKDSAEVLVLPEGFKPVSVKAMLDEYADRPERRSGTARFSDLASFIAHANRFRDAHSALFAHHDPKNPSLSSVLDYHETTAAGLPRFGEHRGYYPFPLSDEWIAWTSAQGKTMDQAAFAEWTENRIPDVADPATAGVVAKQLAEQIGASFASPSRLLELSRGLSIRVGQRIQNVRNLSTGETQFAFVETHEAEAGGPLKVPSAFLIAIPVFRSGAVYQIAVRLRYRAREGSVVWFFELYRADRAFDDAFREACEQARAATELPLFYGSPEA
jgi:uncharacterized protein YfdQ (DUF2303 family)